MPRPEPEIRATLPANLVILFSLSVDLDDGFAVDRRRAGVGDGAHREARAAALAIVEYFGDLAGRSHGGIKRRDRGEAHGPAQQPVLRSEEHTSELQSLMRISYAVFCLKKK